MQRSLLEMGSTLTNADGFPSGLITAKGNLKFADFWLAKQLGHKPTLERFNVEVSSAKEGFGASPEVCG